MTDSQASTDLQTFSKLDVISSPVKITWDKAGIQAALDTLLAKYKGVVVRAEDVKDSKEDMASLNKIAKALADGRKAISQKISAPLKEFETDIKAMEKQTTDTRELIANQVKAYEEAERQARVDGVQSLIDAALNEAELVGLAIPIQANWLNKSISDKTISAEIDNIILKEKDARNRAAMLERAKRDRVTMLQEMIDQQSEKFGFALPLSKFFMWLDIDTDLAKAREAIVQAYTEEQARRSKALERVEQEEARIRQEKANAEASAVTQAQRPTPSPVASPVITSAETIPETKPAEPMPPFDRRADFIMSEGDRDNPSLKVVVSMRFTGIGRNQKKAEAIFQQMKGMATVYGLEITSCHDGKK